MVPSQSEDARYLRLRRIFLVRGQKVMLDSDLARLYRVEKKALNRAVQRNRDRFPDNFVFQLSVEEYEIHGAKLAP